MSEVVELSKLVTGWNEGDIAVRDQVINIIVPMIERFARLEFAKGKSVNTPMLLFTVDEVVQDVTLKILVLHDQKKLIFTGVDHLISTVNKMVFSIIVDAARKLMGGSHAAKRVRAIDTPEAFVAEADPEDDMLVYLMEGVALLEAKYPTDAIAFTLRKFWGFSVDDIASIIGESQRNVYRHLEFAECFLLNHIKGRE